MSSDTPTLSTLARSKLHLSVGGKDSCSLHRWVLLKNSITRSSPSTPLDKTDVNHVYLPEDADNDDEEVEYDDEADSFMFPDASTCGTAGANSSEAEWLDSLLETLGDDDDDFTIDSPSILPGEDEEYDPTYSPLISPMSSSDDLINQQPNYYPPPIASPYPVPYPPFHPSTVTSSYHLKSFKTPVRFTPRCCDPLLSYDMDDIEYLSVPDAIDDTSDNDSDAVSTPSLTRSSSTLSLSEAISIPLASERSPRPHLHIYIEKDDSYFYPFELDPLPFRDDSHHSYNHVYQQC